MIILSKVFLIEFKKIFSQKKTYIIWFVFILMLLLNVKANMIDMEHRTSINLNDVSNLKDVNQNIQNIKSRLSDGSLSLVEKTDYENYLKNAEKQLLNFNILIDKSTDDMLKVKAKIEIIKSQMFEISEGKLSVSNSLIDYNKELRFLQYLYENKIPENNSNYNSFNFIFNFLSGLFPILFLLLVILLSSDIVTKEIEESTIKLILIQPISRIKILSGKYLALIASIISIIFLNFFISFIIIGLKYSIGNPAYPFINNMKYSFDKVSNAYTYIEGSGTYISSLELLIKSILFFMLLCIAVASISFMISVLSNTSTLSMSIGIIINIGLLYMIFGTSILKKLNQYIYISYYNSYDLFSGRITETLNNNQLSPMLGVIQMLIIIIITFGVSCMAFNNKDM
jgi:ABC-2 type transport system permease protein